METIFTVKSQDLWRLSPEEAVSFFSDLLWAEARRLGIPISKIHISSWIDVPDGGVDASVDEDALTAECDLIKTGTTSYQIKADASFKPWQDSGIKQELFGDGKPGKASLGSGVAACLDEEGTYVLVCFKQDPTDKQRRQALQNLRKHLGQCGYANPKAEVWGQSNLIGFLKVFPSLALELNRRGGLRFQTHKSWSQDAEMRKELKAGPAQEELISSIQNELRRDTDAVHIRIWGEPGIGKTKLVLEATRADDLRPCVIYCDSAAKFRDSDLMNEILKEDSKFHVVLVIDECDPDSRSCIWNKLKYRGPRIRLISIHHEYDDTSGNISYFDVPALDNENISNIIQSYDILKDQADRWAGFCSGSPRVAHVVGQNLKNNPEDLLKSPDTVNVWDRYIVRGDDPNSQEVKERRLALQYIALFKKFGFGRPVDTEARTVAEMVKQANAQITWTGFQQIVHSLRKRKILQGEYTLYITPKLLHIKLWSDWWEVFGNSFDLNDFSRDLTPQLVEWFYEMFEYAAESEVASRIVGQLLGENGPFQNSNYLRAKLGARFFLALAKADTESAVECLKRTIGIWSKEQLLQFTTGRREVVWALELIAKRKELFADAARLLLMLGEAENETWSNNASGVFAALFSPAPGQVAPTKASPEERFPILQEALDSDSKERRLLALRACDSALESQHFIRLIGNQPQGLRREPELWRPETFGEIFDAYRRVWNLLRERMDSLPNDEQREAVNILLRHVRALGRIGNLVDMLIDTVNELAKKSYVDNREILAHVLQVLQYEGPRLPPEILSRWEQVRDNFTGTDFTSLLRRYVGMSIWETYDLRDQEEQVQQQIRELAQQAFKDRNLLRNELNWLMTDDAKEGHRFGYELGKIDKGFSLLPELLEAQRMQNQNANAYLLGGYLRALFEGDQEEWEKVLDDIAQDEELRHWLPELTWRSGTTDRASLRVLDLAQKGIIDATQYRIPIYGGIGISENVFQKWIRFLLDHPHGYDAYMALDWYSFFYIWKDSGHALPEELTLQLLLHPSFLGKKEEKRRGQLDDYHWTQIAMKFIELYPRRALEIADQMLEHFGEEGTIFEDYRSETNVVLNEIARQHPNEVWEKITEYLGPPIDTRAFNIKDWLHGGELPDEEGKGMLSVFPLEKIWEWVDGDVEKRAWYLAYFTPKALFRKKEEPCLAREVLKRYGERDDVRENLTANFATEFFTGPSSLHHQKIREEMLAFKKDEDNENVIKWIDEYISMLNEEIKQARIEEEREY